MLYDCWKMCVMMGASCSAVSLKLPFMQYPAIHTNYTIPHCTTLQDDHIHMTRYLGRKEILNTKNNQFNSAAMFALWHEPPML